MNFEKKILNRATYESRALNLLRASCIAKLEYFIIVIGKNNLTLRREKHHSLQGYMVSFLNNSRILRTHNFEPSLASLLSYNKEKD